MPIEIQYKLFERNAMNVSFNAKRTCQETEPFQPPDTSSKRVCSPPSETKESKESSSLLPHPLHENPDPTLACNIPKLKQFDVSLLAHKNPHPWDITVQSLKHVYSVRWFLNQNHYVQDAVSMTTFIAQMFTGFENEAVLDAMRKTPDGKYTGYYENKTREEVRQSWAQANKNGKRAHRLVECYLNNMNCDEFLVIKVFGQFLVWKHTFETEMGMRVFRTEMRIRSSVVEKITGAVDSLWIHVNHPPPEECNSTLTLVMVDWKFKRKYWYHSFVDEKTGKRAMGFKGTPCQEVEDCTFAHDSLQQVGYAHILETWYKDFPYNGHVYKHVRISKMICLQMHDTLLMAIPHLVNREIFTPVVHALFDFRRQQLASKK